MDKKLQSILAMYDKSVVSGSDAASRPDGASDELESRRISEAKFVLDQRLHAKPDASVIDAIVRASASLAPVSDTKSRGGLRLFSGLSTRVYPIRYAAAASVVLIAVVLGITRLAGTEPAAPILADTQALGQAKSDSKMQSEFRTPETAKDNVAPQEGKSQGQGQVQDADRLAARPQSPSLVGEREEIAEPVLARSRQEAAQRVDEIAASSFEDNRRDGRAGQDSLPAWEDDANVRLLQRRIENLRQANADLGWDRPAVPLEQFVRVPAQPGVVPAAAKKQ